MTDSSVQRDYEKLLPQVLDKLFPDPDQKAEIQRQLERYVGPESHRVRLGIVKAANGDTRKIEELVELAKTDFRDVLVQAEYPLSFGEDGLKKDHPEKYQRLIEKEQVAYDQWLRQALAD